MINILLTELGIFLVLMCMMLGVIMYHSMRDVITIEPGMILLQNNIGIRN